MLLCQRINSVAMMTLTSAVIVASEMITVSCRFMPIEQCVIQSSKVNVKFLSSIIVGV